jgi:aminopeptidase N
MPAEQLALMFDHLDHALKVFPAEKRIEGVLQIVNRVTGNDYKWFFDVYLYRAALPKVVATRENGMLKVRGELPRKPPFPMPLDVRVDGKTVTLPMTNGTGETPANAQAGVTIDPSSKILRQLDAVDAFQKWQARPRRQLL